MSFLARKTVAGLFGPCALLVAGFAPARAAEAPEPAPVVLLAVDGMEWDLAIELLEEGRLPHLARLMDRGTAGELRTFAPAMSPVIWTTVATGVAPRTHGIAGFVKKGEGGDRALYTSADRRVKALWNMLTDAGRRSCTVGWWVTYPAEPVEGVMVAQVTTFDPARLLMDEPQIKGGLVPGMDGQVWPPERQAELLEVVGQVDDDLPEITRALIGNPEDRLDPLARKLLEGCRWSLRSDAAYHRIALRLLAEGPPPDLLAVYHGAPDVFGHRFWRYTRPRDFAPPPSAAEVEMAGDFVRAAYERTDAMIGEIVAAAPGANVLVLSDHGMQSDARRSRFGADQPLRFILSGQHREGPPAMLVAAGPSIRRSGPAPESVRRSDLPELGSMVDVAPTVLALLGLPVGGDLIGKAMTDVLTAEHLAAHPITEVPALTPDGWWEARAVGETATLDAEERLEQLRSLGYLN